MSFLGLSTRDLHQSVFFGVSVFFFYFANNRKNKKNHLF